MIPLPSLLLRSYPNETSDDTHSNCFFLAVSLIPIAEACWVDALVIATVGNNSAYAYAGISATGIKRGGYALTCTGRQNRALAFNGATSDSLSQYFSMRIQVMATASVGGGCPGGGGVQDFDTATAGP